MLKPIDLRIQNYYTQTGIEMHPMIMWKYGPGNKKQTAYQISVFREGKCIYTSGKLNSDKQNGIEIPCEWNWQGNDTIKARDYDTGKKVCRWKSFMRP